MGKTIIITSGPTNERIDDVMQITNMSTGNLGRIIADAILGEPALYNQTNRIYYLSPKLAIKPDKRFVHTGKLKYIHITDADSLKDAITNLLGYQHIDAVVHTAAVGDYKARYSIRAEDLIEEILASQSQNRTLDRKQLMDIFENPKGAADDNGKMSSYEPHLMTMMELTPKVIGCIKTLSPKTMLIGCKLLDNVSEEHLLEIAGKLLHKNHADAIIANDLHNIRNGKHPAIIIGPSDTDKDGIRIIERCQTKTDIARIVRNLIFPA